MKLENFPHLVEHIRAKLLQELPTLAAFKQFSPDSNITPVSKDARISAVMLLLYIKKGTWHLLAIRRTKDGGVHSGQIGFPGGRVEPEDNNNEETALRETLEEVGIESENIEVLGALSPVMISVSNFRVYPFVGFVEKLLIKNINTREVAEVLEIPLEKLFAAEAMVDTEIEISNYGMTRNVKAYQTDENTIIWGASALMIKELELIIKG